MHETKMSISEYFPESMQSAIDAICKDNDVEEIRIRINSQIRLVTASGERVMYGSKYFVDIALIQRLFEAFCKHSVYSSEDEQKNGYITLDGGARVGIAGRVVTYADKVVRFCDISSFNLRLARERIGCADGVADKLVSELGQPFTTLVLSPPQAGKTTLLRDIARLLSQRFKVCIVDERSEIAGCVRGIPTCDIGKNTDVLDGVKKSVGIKMALRTLSPEIIITDELGTYDDAKTVLEAASCGVAVIASAHAGDIACCSKRSEISMLNDCTDRVVSITTTNGRRIYKVYAGLFGNEIS